MSKKINMKYLIYLLVVSVFSVLVGCSSSDDDVKPRERTVSYIDVSDFLVCQGSSEGADTIQYNNLKDRDLLALYFDTVYKPILYQGRIVEFFGDKLTYTYPVGSSSNKILSSYVFDKDSLFIINSSKKRVFVALGSSENYLYYKRSMVRYPIKDTNRDTIFSTTNEMSLDKVLQLAGYDSKDNLTNPSDTIAWCNMVYVYN